MVKSWEELEAIWEHCFYSLSTDCAGTDVFLTEAHNPNRANRETTVETMFELFDVGATYLHTQPVLALFATGLTTGVVVDSGEFSTSIYPVADGYHLDNCSLKLPYGGSQITEILARLLLTKGCSSNNSVSSCEGYSKINYSNTSSSNNNNSSSGNESLSEHNLHVARQVKDQFAYAEIPTRTSAATKQTTTANSLTHTLPDGTIITLTDELHNCVEKYFQPRYFNQMLACEADEPIQKAVLRTVMSCSMDIRKSLLNNIVLAGGSTMMQGFDKRFTTELKQIVSVGMSSSVKVKSIPDRSNAIWLGGAILANMSTFDDRWITADDYDEIGPNIVHKRCPIYL